MIFRREMVCDFQLVLQKGSRAAECSNMHLCKTEAKDQKEVASDPYSKMHHSEGEGIAQW